MHGVMLILQVAFLAPEVASTSSSTKAAAEVTRLALSPNSNQLAAGYADGMVRVPADASINLLFQTTLHRTQWCPASASGRPAETAAISKFWCQCQKEVVKALTAMLTWQPPYLPL
jgi:hypothetical protein